jgi:hypothetical protein
VSTTLRPSKSVSVSMRIRVGASIASSLNQCLSSSTAMLVHRSVFVSNAYREGIVLSEVAFTMQYKNEQHLKPRT